MAKKTLPKTAKRVTAKKSAKQAPKKVRKTPAKKSAIRSLTGSYRVYCDMKERIVGRRLTLDDAQALAANHCAGGHSIEASN